MKTLYILRHAKSSWDNPNLADFERPLNERGLRAASLMGKIIGNKQFRIGCILSSPANRAKQTAALVRENAEIKVEIKFEDRIYEASPLTLLQIITDLDEKTQSVMLVGHNPGLEGFIRLLTGEIHAMPTAALAVINLEVANWHQTSSDCGKMLEIIRSKDQTKSKLLA